MAALVQCARRITSKIQRQNLQCIEKLVFRQARLCSSGAPALKDADQPSNKQGGETTRQNVVPSNYRQIYPEFLPDPKVEWRNVMRERLERADMMKRRSHIDIPEFYVGTIMAVTFSDKHAVSKNNRFVGICIQRKHCGLRAEFTLRNFVDGQGIEMRYEMYDPRIQKIEVLRLEKRPDDELLYLRDAYAEFCTFPFDMEPDILPEGAPVPVNPIKVKLRPRPWYDRWERKNLQGVQPLELKEKFFIRAKELETPWEEFDLMKQYRATIPEEQQNEIFAEVYSELHQLELTRKKLKRRRTFQKPKKQA